MEKRAHKKYTNININCTNYFKADRQVHINIKLLYSVSTFSYISVSIKAATRIRNIKEVNQDFSKKDIIVQLLRFI